MTRAQVLEARDNAEARYAAACEALWVVIYVQELQQAGLHSPTAQESAQAARLGLATSIWGVLL